MKSLFSGVRTRLLLLAVVAIAPLLVFRLFEIQQERAALTEHAQLNTVLMAREEADRQIDRLEKSKFLLSAIGQLSGVSSSWAQCTSSLSGLKKTQPWLDFLAIADVSGKVVCGSGPALMNANLGNSPYILEARERRGFVVSHMASSQVDGNPLLMIGALPELNADGEIKRFLLAGFNDSLFTDLARDLALQIKGDVFVVDTAANVLGASIESGAAYDREMIGSRLQNLAFNAIHPWDELTTLGGDNLIFGFAGVPGTSARIFVGQPTQAILASVDAQLARAYSVVAISTILIFVLAWAGGEYIFVRPIKQLSNVADKVSEGDTQARARIDSGFREIDHLAVTFNAMVERLNEIAHVDGLTGLSNRRHLDSFLKRHWADRTRAETPIGIAMIDVDNFKAYNDHFEHLGGDICLKKVADAIGEFGKRSGDMAARFGGEEFSLVLIGQTKDEVDQAYENLRARIEAHSLPQAPKIGGVVTASIGYAYGLAGDYKNPEDMIAEADRALYAAKQNGRNRVVASGEDVDEETLDLLEGDVVSDQLKDAS